MSIYHGPWRGKRVLPARVRAAYVATNARPLYGAYEQCDPTRNTPAMCALSAVYCAEYGERVSEATVEPWMLFSNNLDLYDSYIAGYMAGFDGRTIDEVTGGLTRKGVDGLHVGYGDGVAARAVAVAWGIHSRLTPMEARP